MRTVAVIKPESTISRSKSAAAQELDDALVMQDSAGAFYGLEAIGKRTWQLLEQPRTVAALCATLQGEYDVDHDTCQRDILEFLADLHNEGLVELT